MAPVMLGTLRRTPSMEALGSAALHRPAVHAGIVLRFRQHSLQLPSEMWGAASLALQLSRSTASTGLSRVASAWTQPLSTSAGDVPEPSGDEPKSITEALAYTPALTPLQDALCLLAAAGACAAVYVATAPAAFQLRYAAGMALLYAGLLALARSWALERKYKALQRSERELADLDSKFMDMEGIEVHYKSRRPRQPPPLHPSPAAAAAAAGQQHGEHGPCPPSPPAPAPPRAVHCLHGFGASAYSWSFAQEELASELKAVVTAHDMPGFGLTQRPADPRYYTLRFNGAAARAVMDAELGSQQGQQAQRVLVGHSMGGAAVAEGVIQNPEGISAIILVAPAIVALWAGPPQQAQRDSVAAGLAVVEEVVSAQDAPDELEVESDSSLDSDSSMGSLSGLQDQAEGWEGPAPAQPGEETQQGTGAAGPPPGPEAQQAAGQQPKGRHSHHSKHHTVRHRGPKALRMLAAVAQASAFVLVRLVLRLAAPLLVPLLRRLVRDRRFWERGLQSAWVDKSRVGREYVDAYRSGQLVRGWEAGILNFLAGRFAEKLSFWDTLAHVVRGDGHLSQAERLARVVEEHGIKVLIVHGTDDILVPAANSRRLARLLPGAKLVEFERCGHMPQEEAPERFVREVAAFLQEAEEGKGEDLQAAMT